MSEYDAVIHGLLGIDAEKKTCADFNRVKQELEFQQRTLDEHAIVSNADVFGNITYVNDKFISISGYTREELLGKNHRMIKSGEHAPEFYKEMWRTIARGRPWHGEIKNKNKNGLFYWVQATIVPFLNEQGKPFKYISIRTDITAMKALEKNLIVAKEQAEAAARQLVQERELIENIILKMRHADQLDERHLRYLISPVEVTAGDVLFATVTADGRQLVLLGDFTGHGLPAAIGGPLVSYIFYELARRNFSGDFILSEINRQLCLRLPTGIFFAAILLEIAANRKQATHWNMGLPDTLLMRHQHIQSHFPPSIFPLGIALDADLSGAAVNLALENGDRLYIYTDGIIEAKDNQQMLFGRERLAMFIEKIAISDGELTDLITLLNEHVGSKLHEDDITLVEIQV